jgi:hypothetical protein
MAFQDDYIRRLEAEIAELKSDLAPLESGAMHLGERKTGGLWVDTTQREIKWHKKMIAMFEGIVAKARTGKSDR